MASMGITKVSSKGQIVIPLNMRGDLKEGEEIVVIKNQDQIILKKMDKFSKNLKEDLEFARRTEEAWKQYERGEFVSSTAEEFLKELSKV
jgi:AbrB family looped-hinge helix DNA binding protein